MNIDINKKFSLRSETTDERASSLSESRKGGAQRSWPGGDGAWKALSLPMLAFLVLPLAALVLRAAPVQVWSKLSSAAAHQAIALSLTTALITTLTTVAFGTPLAYLLAHDGKGWRRVAETVIDLPTVLPPAVAGVALLMAFGRRGLFGGLLDSMGVQVTFTTAAVVLAQTFVASPYYIRSAITSFSEVDPELRHSAALDGAGEWQIFRHVMAPIAWSGLLSGSVMAWARAMGEFGATIIFAGNFPGRTQTMPLAIYLGFEMDLNTALALSVILLASSFLTLLAVKSFLRKEKR